MSREDLLRMAGVVIDVLSAGLFRVKLENGKQLSAKLSGRLRRYRIRVLVGDKVTLGFSPYDLTHGLILSREKLEFPRGRKP